MPSSVFQEKLIIEDKNRAILEANTDKSNIKLQCDRSKLENAGTRSAVVWEKYCEKKKQQEQKVDLGLNDNIFDAEIQGISEAFKVAVRKT